MPIVMTGCKFSVMSDKFRQCRLGKSTRKALRACATCGPRTGDKEACVSGFVTDLAFHFIKAEFEGRQGQTGSPPEPEKDSQLGIEKGKAES